MRLSKHLNEASASKTTTLQESLHCVGIGIVQFTNKPLTESQLLDGNLFDQAYNRFCSVDIGSNEIYTFAQKQPSWVKSVVNNVNALKKSKWLKGSRYKIYRGMGLMNQVYATASNLLKKEKIRLNPDKWNPGDIWLSTHSSIPSFNDISEYNDWISSELRKGNLIGVSLKKTSGSPKVVYIDQGSEKPTIRYKSIKKPTNVFNTGISILTDNPKVSINVRSFNISKRASITSEMQVKGSAARHGKTALPKYINKYKIPQMTVNDIKKYLNDVEYLNNLVVSEWMANGHTFSDTRIQKDWLTRVNNMQDVIGYYRSIINSLQYGAFLNKNKGIADEIITDMFRTGSSMGDYSSDFLKVS